MCETVGSPEHVIGIQVMTNMNSVKVYVCCRSQGTLALPTSCMIWAKAMPPHLLCLRYQPLLRLPTVTLRAGNQAEQ